MTRFGNQTLLVDTDPGFLLAINTSNWNKLFKASLFHDLLDFETASREAQDMLLQLMIYPLCNKVAFIEESLYLYRVRSGSLIEKSSLDDIEVLVANLSDIRTKLVTKTSNDCFLEICDVMALTHIGLSLPLRQVGGQKQTYSRIMRKVRSTLEDQFPLYLETTFTTIEYSKARQGLNSLLRWAQWAYRLRVASFILSILRFARCYLGYEASW